MAEKIVISCINKDSLKIKLEGILFFLEKIYTEP